CLADLYVISDWRRRGVGTLLCRRAVRMAGRLHLPTLHLYTKDSELFYQRLGWRKVTDAVIEDVRGLELAAFMSTPSRGRVGRRGCRPPDSGTFDPAPPAPFPEAPPPEAAPR